MIRMLSYRNKLAKATYSLVVLSLVINLFSSVLLYPLPAKALMIGQVKTVQAMAECEAQVAAIPCVPCGTAMDCSKKYDALAKCIKAAEEKNAELTNSETWKQWVKNWAKEEKKEIRKKAWAIAYKSALHLFLNTMAYDIANWLASGAAGQQPMFFTEGWGEYLTNLADSALGTFMEELSVNWLNFNICEPFDPSIKIGLTLGLEKMERPRPSCRFTDVWDNFESYASDPDIFNRIEVAFQPENNNIGMGFSLYAKYFQKKQEIIEAGVRKRESGEEHKGVISKISEKILTPASYSKKMGEMSIEKAIEANVASTGDIRADAINTFTQTLMGKLIELFLQKGLAALRGIGDSSSSSSQSFSTDRPDLFNEDGSGQRLFAGQEEARGRSVDLLTAGIVSGGPYEILQELVSCPELNNPGPDECVIDESLRFAIEQEMTVGEAIDNGNLDGDAPFGFITEESQPPYNEGYPYRSLLILRTHRIIPITWEIAAEAIRHKFETSDKNRIYTLNDLIAVYNNHSSMFYHLIDRNWVLKAPEHFCRVEGYGPRINSDNLDDISTISRDKYCADYTSCIDEADDGSCRFYGYCMEERRIWDLQGISCPDYYNTCRTFQDSDQELVSYLENTLEYNGCSVENVGCQWYCRHYNTISDVWTCLAAGEKVIKPCNQSIPDPADPEILGCPLSAGCEMDIGEFFCYDLDAGIGIEISEPCNQNSQWYDSGLGECDVTANCTIPTGGVECIVAGCGSLSNFLPNSGFEIGPSSGGLPESWAGDLAYFAKVSGAMERIYSGNNSLRFFSYGQLSGSKKVESTIVALPAGSYTFSGYVYNDLNVGDIEIKIMEEVPGSPPSYIEIGNTLSTEKRMWQRLVTDFDIGTSDTNVKVEIILSGDQVSGSAWFDNFKISESCTVNPIRLTLVGDIERNESKVFLDRDAQACPAEADGCSEFIRLKENLGTNVVPNGSFEPLAGNDLDLGQGEFGWAGDFEETTETSAIGTGSVKLENTGKIYTAPNYHLIGVRPETGYYLSFWAKVDSSDDSTDSDLEAKLKWKDASGQGEEALFLINNQEKITLTPDWRQYRMDATITPATIATSSLEFFNNSASKIIYLDAVQLEAVGIQGNVSEYSDYGSNNLTYLKKPPAYISCTGDYFNDPDECNQYALYCSQEEVGCDAYTPVDGGSSIPAITAMTDYCPAECVGYEAYKQSISFFERREDLVYFIPSTARSCNASNVGCDQFTNLDEVAAGGEGLEYYQYLRLCEKPEAGNCQNYYTWLGSDESGYQLRVYNLVKDASADYPKEAIPYDSDKVDDLWPSYWCNDTTEGKEDLDGNKRPKCCDGPEDLETNLFCRAFYDDAGTIYYRIYDNTVFCSDNCHPFRKASYGESVDDASTSCTASNGNWDSQVNACIYDAIPGQGVRCSAQSAGCREYRGNTAGNIYTAFSDNFDNFSEGDYFGWQYGTLSPKALSVGGHSLESVNLGAYQVVETAQGELSQLDPLNPKNCSENNFDLCSETTLTNCYDASAGRCVAEITQGIAENTCFVELGETECGYIENYLQPNKTYLISFWAKSADSKNINNAALKFYNGNPSNPTDSNEIGTFDLWTDWNYYLFGPIHIDEVKPGTQLAFWGPGSSDTIFYIDNVEIKEVNDYVYAVRNSWNTPISCDMNLLVDPPVHIPQYMLGCEQYYDTGRRVHNLKSFNSLCRDKAVGCEALIDTFNHYSPFAYSFNSYDSDSEIELPGDKLVYLVNQPENRCEEEFKGCQALGNPNITFDNLGNDVVAGYGLSFLINDPERYEDSILCTSEEVGCDEFQTGDGMAYFKNPGQKTCEYRTFINEDNFGWYKTGSSSLVPDCPIWQPSIGALHPTSDFVGICDDQYNTCTQFIDPASEFSKNLIYNSNIEDFQDYNGDGIPDGWFGVIGTPEITQTLILKSNTLYSLSIEAGEEVNVKITNCQNITSFDNSLGISDENGDEVNETATLVFGPSNENSMLAGRQSWKSSGRFLTSRLNSRCDVVIENMNLVNSIHLGETGLYYVLNNSIVDRKYACNGIVDLENNCVLFNDRSGINYKYGEEDTSYLVFDSDISGPTVNDGVPAIECHGMCDSNVILKVRPDRQCSEWLECATHVTEVDKDGIEKDYCLDLIACSSLAENGVCDQIRLYDKEDEDMFTKTESPLGISQIKNYTGFAKIGVNWQSEGFATPGYLPYNLMSEEGEASSLPNGNFESVHSDNRPMAWSIESYGIDPLDNIWEPYKFEVGLDSKDRKQDIGYLKLYASHRARSEVTDLFGKGDFRNNSPEVAEYTLSAWINTSDLEPVVIDPGDPDKNTYAQAEILFRFTSDLSEIMDFDVTYLWFLANNLSLDCREVDVFGDSNLAGWIRCSDLQVKAGLPWQQKSLKFNAPDGIQGIELLLVNTLDFPDDTNCSDKDDETICRISGLALFDDITIKPVLRVDNDDQYLNRSCRIYPSHDALSCKYTRNDVLYYGNYGYCLAKDPQNSNICLQWWPIDKIKGEVLDEVGGYKGSVPAYYCLDGEYGTNFEISGEWEGIALSEGDHLFVSEEEIISVSSGKNVVLGACHLWYEYGEQEATYGAATKRLGGAWSPTENTVLGTIGRAHGSSGNAFAICAVYDPEVAPQQGKDYTVINSGDLYDAIDYLIRHFKIEGGDKSGSEGGGGDEGGGENKGFTYAPGPIYIHSYDQSPIEALKVKCLSPDCGDDDCDYEPILTVVWGFDYAYNQCTEIVQTVTSAGVNKAWLTRASHGTNYNLNFADFGWIPNDPEDLPAIYKYGTLIPPFGTVVPRAGSPFTWFDIRYDNAGTDAGGIKKPIHLANFDYQSGEYDVNGGVPYRNHYKQSENEYVLDGDMYLFDTAPKYFGQCSISKSMCMDVNFLSFWKIPGCPIAGEECIINNGNYPSADEPQKMIRTLFAEQYGVWEWNDDDINGKYDKQEDAYPEWKIPTVPCGAVNRPSASDIEDFQENGYCYIPPVITELKVDNLEIIGSGSIRLDFNAKVDPDQMPLRFFKVDWSDGSVNSVSGTKLRSRINPEYTFTFYHFYDYWKLTMDNKDDDEIYCGGENTPGGLVPDNECWIRPKVWVQDNWFKESDILELDEYVKIKSITH